MQGVVDARDEVLKNVVIVYSQASVRYASKMTVDLDEANGDYDKHQAEGHAFFRVIEAYVADHTDSCYNNQTHGMAYIGASEASTCDAFSWMPYQGSEVCYNTAVHMVYAPEGVNQTICEGFASVFPGSGMPGYYADYGASKIVEVFDLKNDGDTDADYEADVRTWLQPVWDHFGITADDIGTLQ